MCYSDKCFSGYILNIMTGLFLFYYSLRGFPKYCFPFSIIKDNMDIQILELIIHLELLQHVILAVLQPN